MNSSRKRVGRNFALGFRGGEPQCHFRELATAPLLRDIANLHSKNNL